MRTAAIPVIIALSGWYAAGDADSLASMFAGDAWQMPRLEADGQWRVVSDAPVSEMPR
jgi:hypothetical protein